MSEKILRLDPGRTSNLLNSGEMSLSDETRKRNNFEKAQEIFEEDFFGSEQVANVLNIEIPQTNIPDIPFTMEEMRRSKDLGQRLILRINKTVDNTPITMKWIHEQLESRFLWSTAQRDISQSVGYFNEHYYVQDVPRSGWALVGKEILAGSKRQFYLDQIGIIADYLRNIVFNGRQLPPQYLGAITSFYSQKSHLSDLAYGSERNRKKGAEVITRLPLNRLTRQTAVEALYDDILSKALLPIKHTSGSSYMTATQYSDTKVIVYLENNSYYQDDDSSTKFKSCIETMDLDESILEFGVRFSRTV